MLLWMPRALCLGMPGHDWNENQCFFVMLSCARVAFTEDVLTKFVKLVMLFKVSFIETFQGEWNDNYKYISRLELFLLFNVLDGLSSIMFQLKF